MKLSIYSLKKILFSGEAKSLNCKTPLGEITVLDNHETLITVLTAGTMMVFPAQGGPALGWEIKSGFLEVRHGNEIRCIVEQ
jgi:F0F1-type ATP synthase epsilon subunit